MQPLGIVWKDESGRLLLLVCLPLVLLLVVVIVLLRRGWRKSITFPRFSVVISSVGREEAYVTYRDDNRRLEFAAEIGKGRKLFRPQISLQVSRDLPVEDVREIIPNIALALARLHYEYVVFRKGEPRAIPEPEREAAIAELRQMGYEIKKPAFQGQVQRAVISSWHRFSREQTKDNLQKLKELMSAARGIRESIEILARSDSEH